MPRRCRRTALSSSLALLVLLPAARAPGQVATPAAGAPLPLAEAVRLAVGSHPAARSATARATAAAAGVELARAALRPTADLTATATRYQEPMVVTPIHGFTPGDLPTFDKTLAQGGLHLDHTLWDGGARAAVVDERGAAARAAAAGAEGAVQEVVAATVGTYLRALSVERILDAHHLRESALDAELARVREVFAAGATARVEVKRVEAACAAARAERVAAATALASSLRDLARFTGLPPAALPPASLVPVALATPDAPPREELLTALEETSPALRRAREELAAAEAALRLARAEDRPRLRGGARWLHFGSAEGDFTAEWNAGLTLAVPLYRGGATAARVARAEAAREAAAQGLAAVRLEAGQALDLALAEVADAGARAASLAEAEAALAEVVRVERLRLETGVGVEADYLTAEADLLATRARLAEARFGEMAARAGTARAAGELDPEWVERELVARPRDGAAPAGGVR